MLENTNLTYELKKWIENHTDFSLNIVCSSKTNAKSTHRYVEYRDGAHSKVFDDLISFKNQIYKEIESISSRIIQLQNDCVVSVLPLIYENQKDNLIIRKFAFVEHKLKRVQMKILQLQYSTIMNIGEQTTLLMTLFKSDLIPQNIICSISPNFFQISKNFHKDPKILKQVRKLQMLSSYYQKLKNVISHFQKPIWRTEQGYSKFLIQLIHTTIDKVDQFTNYIPPQQCELSLSRCLFSNKTVKQKVFDSTTKPANIPQFSCHYTYDETSAYISDFIQRKSTIRKDSKQMIVHYNQYQPMIDNVINRFPNMEPKEFTQSLLFLAKSLIPFDVCRQLQTTNESSLIVTYFYRVLFERVYEKFDYFFINFDVNKKLSKFLNNLKMDFSNDWPFDYMNVQFINSTNHDSNSIFDNKSNLNLTKISKKEFDQLNVKDYFRNDGYFQSAAEFLNETMFCSNPIDALFQIAKSLSSIQKGAVIHKIQKKQLPPECFDHVLCFDDNFTLLIGTFIASEIPNLFSLNWFIQSYSPSTALSSPLEFAYVNIEGLTKYISSIYNQIIKHLSE